MGSTLEAQKAKAPKKKAKKPIVVTPDRPYYSSKALRGGYAETLPAATVAAQSRYGALGVGKFSPRAAALDAATRLIDQFRSDEGVAGSRLARKVAKQEVKRKRYRKGGIARKTRVF
jgi:hypothetical protein